MEGWAWPIILMLVGIGLAVLEVFFVSYGLLSLLAITSIVAAIVLGFMHSQELGLTMLVTAVLGLPTGVILALYWWPRTPIGRRVLLTVPDQHEVLPDSPQLRDLQRLVGRVGKAKAPLLPSGPVIIDGRTIDAVSEGMPVEAGQWVRVVEVRGTWVSVRRVDEHEAEANQGPSAPDPLDQPVDSVVPDPFRDTQVLIPSNCVVPGLRAVSPGCSAQRVTPCAA